MNYCCAGVVLYNPDINRLKENISSIINQVDKIIIVDNNSINIEEVINQYSTEKRIIFVENPNNKGIATALNQICEVALNDGYEWVLLLDQDSVCSPSLVKSYKNFITDNRVALLSPYIVDINKLTMKNYYKLNLPVTSLIDWAITSGSLIKLQTWKKVEGFYDDLFIDAVDLDYSKKLKINGYKQIRVNNEYLLQEVGHAEPTWIIRPHKDNAGEWTIKRYYRTNHSLVRQYFMTRNRIILARKFSKYDNFIKDIIFTIVMTIPKLLVEKNKLKLMKTLIRGFYDGFKYSVDKYICVKKEGNI